MATLNKVQLIGRLGRDPELRQTQTGKPVANFSIATDESYKDQSGNKVERTEWHDIVAWDRSGENAANMLRKGSLVYLEGKLQTRSFTDQQGQERRKTEIVCEKWQFLEPKRQDGQAGDYAPPPQPRQQQAPRQAPQGQRQAPQRQQPPQQAKFPDNAEEMEDVPF